jgi:hypothetical protein
MRTVAERRFDDAQALCDTNANSRANGVAYLAGFVVEILLKASLVEKNRGIARKRQHELAETDREVWSLIWRRHDLDAMLDHMPELEAALKVRSGRAGQDYNAMLKAICATWTIQARYSPLTMLMRDARDMLARVRKLKEVLK